MSKETTKNRIQTEITSATTNNSITPTIVGTILDEIIELPIVDSRPYKVYTCLLSCTDSLTPVVTIFENSIGNIVWTRNAIGSYKAELTDAFTLDKTIGFSSINNGYVVTSVFSVSGNDNIIAEVRSLTTGNYIDYIEKLALEIRVYN